MQEPINEKIVREDIEKILDVWLKKRETDPRGYQPTSVCAQAIVYYIERLIKHREASVEKLDTGNEGTN